MYVEYMPDESSEPIVIEITEITRLGLVTVSFNQPLNIRLSELIVQYN